MALGGGGGGGVGVMVRRMSKNFFSALRASVWSTFKGGGAGAPGPSPGSATGMNLSSIKRRVKR